LGADPFMKSKVGANEEESVLTVCISWKKIRVLRELLSLENEIKWPKDEFK